ncbi:MAG: acetyl-CoA carboxylase biotin carboxyl carrier protein [Bacteroidetes bacterium]|nr:acetyl-CoA carboxylase biotin carboxyl carrier protein [Bacteroidota bacterium]
MEFKQIQELIKIINKSNISELNIEDGDFKITIKQAAETQFVAMPQAVPQMVHQAVHAPAPAQPQVAAPAPQAAAPAPSAGSDKLVTVKSPMIGTFYRSSGPDKPAFVSVGDEVKQGQVLCIIEAMKLFNEIESEVSGTIVKVLVDDASPVEYDQPLFLVEP